MPRQPLLPRDRSTARVASIFMPGARFRAGGWQRLPLILSVLLTLLLCPPPRLQAHALSSPKALHVRVSKGAVRLELRYDLAAGLFAEELRHRYDANKNGWLDDNERGHLQDYLEVAATTFLKLHWAGTPLSLKRTARTGGPFHDKLPSRRGIQSTLIFESRLPPGKWDRGILHLEDRHPDAAQPVQVSAVGEGGVQIIEGRVLFREGGTAPAERKDRADADGVFRGLTLDGQRRLELDISVLQGR